LGITYGKTGLVDAYEFQSLAIGTGMMSSRKTFQRGPALADVFFNPRFAKFRPVETLRFSSELLTDLAWKIEETPARTPSFEEARGQVEKTWTTQRARILATDKAKEISVALDSVTGEDPWVEVIDESTRQLIIKPPAFTWLRPAMMQGGGGPELAEIEGVFRPGAALVERCFTTPVGKSSYAFDEVQEKCFVIKVVERTPSEEDLYAAFERAPLSQGAQQLASVESMVSFGGFFRNISREANLDLSKLEKLENE
jgi:hypothetical protein